MLVASGLSWWLHGVVERLTFVESLQVVELGSEAALAGGVDDEDDLALEVGERVDGALVVLGLEVEE